MFDMITGFLEKSGYIGVFALMALENIFPPIPSEVIMPLAGYQAATGNHSFIAVVLAGTFGSILGILPWYYLGLWFGEDIVEKLPHLCRQTDRPVYGLLTDLEQRGLLQDTLVVWGGEFGRTPMNEARGGSRLMGRDHHPRAFTIWMVI